MNFSELHTHYTSLAIGDYLAQITARGEQLTLGKNTRLDITPGNIYFILSGTLSLGVTGSELIIGNAIEHMPVGLMERYCPLVDFVYKCTTDVTLIKLTCDAFDDIFITGQPENARQLSIILSYMTIFTLDLHTERRKLTSYQTIKPMLERYLYRVRTHSNETEGLAAFIMRRTRLSRTHVFRVLADLRQGGYITVEKGRLISIDRTLPDDY